MDEKKLMISLALGVVIGLFIMSLMLFFIVIPKENESALNMLIGAVIAAFSGIIGYYFGSSKGSAEKTAAIISAGEAAKAL